jgi:hypothetical protein
LEHRRSRQSSTFTDGPETVIKRSTMVARHGGHNPRCARSAKRRGDNVEAVECDWFYFERPGWLMREGPAWLPYPRATVKIVRPARRQVRKARPTLLQRRAGRDCRSALSFDPLGRSSGASLGDLRHRSSRNGSVHRA